MQEIKSMSNYLCIIIKRGTKGRMHNFIQQMYTGRDSKSFWSSCCKS
jgi:hypothetical protein